MTTRVWTLASFLFVAAAAFLLLRYAPVQTDLLSLLPATERSAAAERSVAAMRDAAGNRAVFLVGHADPVLAAEAARRFAEALTRSGAFASVHLRVADFDPHALAAPHREFRFGLLTEADRSALAEGRIDIEQWLLRRLNDPFGARLASGMAQDPFGFLENYISSLPYAQSRLDLEEGLLVVRDGADKPSRLYVLVSGELRGSAYEEGAQRAVVAAVGAADQAAREIANDTQVLRTGAVFYAEAARSSAERDVELIGAGSLIGIVLLMVAVFRSLRPLLFGLLTVLTGLAAAVSTMLVVHGELHVLTLVFGASLIGEAIDYSIQYFAIYAASGSRWDSHRAMRAVRPGLSLALATSVLGYAALLFMSFPAVRQIALFALSGLIAAYLAVILLLPHLLKSPYEGNIDPVAVPSARFIEWWKARVGAKPAVAIALAALALCAPGWLLLQADDDVRALTSRPAALLQQEARIRSLTGVEIGTHYFVVEGKTPETTLQAEERLVARLRELSLKGELANFQAISSFVPSAARQEDNRALLRKTIHSDGKLLEQAFEHVGLRSGVAGELERAYQQSEGRLLTPEAWLATPGAAPFRHLWLGKTESGYSSVVIPTGAKNAEALAAVAADLPGVSFVDKAASVSRLFSQYRKGLSYGLIGAMVLVLGLLCWRYGRYGGVATLLPAGLGIAAALAVTGYIGSAITVFSMMALMLVLGVGVNYSIFLMEGRARPGTTGVAVLLSASTTVLSFGLLAFSGTPALSGFGATLLTGIAVTVLATPLALSLSPEATPGK